MTPTLLKDTAGSLTAYIERASDGSAAVGLAAADLSVDIKKAGASSFSALTLIDPVQATADIGSGADGTVTTTVDAFGVGGNSYTVEVIVPAGTSGLTTSLVGAVLEVNLAVIGGAPDAAQNTATLVAAAISLESGVTAVASGTGADSLSGAEGPTSFTGGLDGNLREFSLGFYEIDLAAADTSAAGSLDVRWAGPTVRTGLLTAFVAEVTPTSPIATQPPPLSSLFGFVYDAEGQPVAGAAASARVLSQPTVLHPFTEGMALSTSLVTALTDSDGFFTLSLVAGTQVDFMIPASGYRRTLTVPSTATNVYDIP
jgi:hypothetical protein